jgi:hypothetical protein
MELEGYNKGNNNARNKILDVLVLSNKNDLAIDRIHLMCSERRINSESKRDIFINSYLEIAVTAEKEVDRLNCHRDQNMERWKRAGHPSCSAMNPAARL